MPSFPASGSGSLNPAYLANEVFVSPGGSNSSSGRAGAPKRTIYDGLETLIARGGGTLTCDSLCTVGGPVEGQGIRLRVDFLTDDGYFFDAPGFLPLTVPIRILGIGNSSPAGPFTLAPTTDFIGGGNGQFNPPLWLVGCPIPNTAFEMTNMQSSWLHQWNSGNPANINLRAGKMGARIFVDFDRELNGEVKQIPVLNATRTGNSTVLTVDIDAVTPVTVDSAARSAEDVVTLTLTNPGYPFAPWSKRGHIKLVSSDPNFPGGDKLITGIHNWAATNTTWTITYDEAGDTVPDGPVTGVEVLSHGCSEGELIWLTSSNIEFPSQQYYVTSVTDDTVTILDRFGSGDADEDDIGTIARQERRCVPLINTRFERCSFGIDSAFSPDGATHGWDLGSNLAVYPDIINCWGEGSISGGGLPYYDWRNFSAFFAYGGSGGGQDDAGASAYLRKFQCNNGGIMAEASPYGATTRLIVTENSVVEQASFDSEEPGIYFRGNNYSSIYVEDFLNADGDPDAFAVKLENHLQSAAYVNRAGKVDGPCIGGDSWLTPSNWLTNYPSPWTRGQVTTWADGRLSGKHPSGPRSFGVVTARFANMILDAASWVPDVNATVTPGGGETGPDGNATDLIETANVANIVLTANNDHGVVVAEGGKLVFSGWFNSDTTLRSDLVTIDSNQFELNPGSPGYAGTGWQFVSVVFSVGEVSSSPPNFFCNITLPANANVSAYGLSLVYVPEDVDDNDAYEYAGTTKGMPRYLLPGLTGTMEGQKLIGHGGLGCSSSSVEITSPGTADRLLTIYGPDGTPLIKVHGEAP